MPELKLLRIEEGDDQKSITDKVNFNFSETLSYGGGPYGKIGPVGPNGNPGLIGPTGSYGDMGSRGNVWVIDSQNPGSTGYISGDLWLNTLDSGKIYEFSSGQWILTNQFLSSQELFRVYSGLQTSSGPTNYKGYFLNGSNPQNYTLVLKDSSLVGATASTNPQYSKVLISTNGGATGRGILEFGKTDYLQFPSATSKNPRFYWTSTSTSASLKYGLTFKTGGSIFFNSSSGSLKFETLNSISSINLKSIGFNMNLTGSSGLNITSQTGRVYFDFSSTGSANFSTNNLSYSSGFFNIPVAFSFNSSSSDTNPPLLLQSNSSSIGNFRYRSSALANRSSRLFRTYDSSNGEIFFDAFASGEIYFNKKINSMQEPQTRLTSNSAHGALWFAVVPTITTPIYTTSGLGPNGPFLSSNGFDVVMARSQYNPVGNTGVYLWTPATGGSVDNNGGWLNLLNNYEALTVRVRSIDENKTFRYIGISTASTYSNAPTYGGFPEIVDLSGTNTIGASQVEFTVLNITGTGATSGSSRWFKVYYSAWGGNLNSVKCGFLYTYNSTAI